MPQTLTSIFDAGRVSLEQKLEGLTLPDDAERIQSILKQGLMELVAPKGEYRLSLTMSEDAILQDAIALLDIQQRFLQKTTASNQPKPHATMQARPVAESIPAATSVPIAGSAIGGAAGALFGPWTAVIGAIAGTAAATYCREFIPVNADRIAEAEPERNPEPISPCAMTDIIRTICEQIDHLLAVCRRQIADLKLTYENREKVTLSRDFGFLLESIQSVIGASYSVETEKGIERLKDRCGQLSESLENYGLRTVVYTDNCPEHYFEITRNETLDTPATRMPAILKGDRVVLKGKAVIPNK